MVFFHSSLCLFNGVLPCILLDLILCLIQKVDTQVIGHHEKVDEYIRHFLRHLRLFLWGKFFVFFLPLEMFDSSAASMDIDMARFLGV